MLAGGAGICLKTGWVSGIMNSVAGTAQQSAKEAGSWGSDGVRESGPNHVRGFVMRRAVEQAAIQVRRLWVVGLLVGGLASLGMAQSQDTSLLQPQGLDYVGIYALRQSDPALTGEGVRIGVLCRSVTYKDGEPQNDYQPNVRHACFQAARIRSYDKGLLAPGVSPHSTAVCSILFGEDAEATTSFLGPFLYQGVVPAAEGHVYEYFYFGEQHLFTQTAPSVDVITASFGFQFENWWTRGIESLAEHAGLPVIASVGNGTNASDPPLYPGAGSNAIGVGVVSSVKTGNPVTDLMHFALAYPDQSTLGPTEDDRCKPDIVAPGNCLVAAATEDRGYTMSGDWSSFATPVTAGVVGLLIQAARMDKNLSPILSPNGGNCALKAILMNSATKLPFWHKGRLTTEDDREEPLDYIQGAGMVNAVRAHRLLTAGRAAPGNVPATGWDLNVLDAASQLPQVYRFTVDESVDKVFTATLIWNRHYSDAFPFERLSGTDSDLRIEVWAIDPENSANDLLLDMCDSKVDNVEHIHVSTLPEYRLYELVVSYADGQTVAFSERYGLAWMVADKPESNSILWHDLNADGVVDGADVRIFLANRRLGLTSPDAYVIGDINTDGALDAADLESLIANRNRKAGWRTDTVTN